MSMFGMLATMKLGEATSGGGFWMPEGASTIAPEIDGVFYFINNINYLFFAICVGVLLWFGIRYRAKPSAHTTFTPDAPTHNTPLELTWTVVPLLLVGVMFWLGMVGFLELSEAPDDSYEVQVTAQKWSWTSSRNGEAAATEPRDHAYEPPHPAHHARRDPACVAGCGAAAVGRTSG